jgi:plasmid stability protein
MPSVGTAAHRRHRSVAIHAVVAYHPDVRLAHHRDVEAEAREELMIGISRESLRGRAGGARTALVLVEGDREIAGFFRDLEERYHPPAVA